MTVTPDRHALSPIRGASTRARVAVFAALLAGATLVAYLPALRAGFVWDDGAELTRNVNLRPIDGLRRIWLEPTSTPQYYPLVHTTLWIEHRFWGIRPAGYQAVNVVLHAANAILVGVLLLRPRVPGAWLAAALAFVRFFGLEPDHERARGRRRDYAAGFALFLCALAGKTVTASLPAALGAGKAAAALLLAILGARTYPQSKQYRDAETLWRATLATNPAAPLAHHNLGLILARRNDPDGAIAHCRAALVGNPLLYEAEYSLANALLAKGETAEALSHFEHVTGLAPGDPRARYNYGIALIRLDRPEDAIGHLEAAVCAAPDFVEARFNLGLAPQRAGRTKEAVAEFNELLWRNPGLAQPPAAPEPAR